MLSICLIVKNEGSNIKECLASFSFLADQFVVVDTGSSDDTKSIAASMGANVLDFKWCDDFSAARNFALDQVETDWIMMIDADNRIAKEDAIRLKSFLSKEGKGCELIDLKYEFNGSYAYMPRIWRNDLKLKYRYPVHEYLEVPKDLRRIQIDVVIQGPLMRNYIESRKYYVEIMEAYVKTHPDDQRMLYYLISDNRFLKRYKKVIEWGEKYLISDPKSNNQVARVFIHMGYALWKLKLLAESEQAFHYAIQFDDSLVDSYLYLGDLKSYISEFDTACVWFKKAEECSFQGYKSHYLNPDKYSFEPKRKLALTFVKLGEMKEAVNYAEKALELKPTDKGLQSIINSYRS